MLIMKKLSKKEMKELKGAWGWYNVYQPCWSDEGCPFVCDGSEVAAFYCNGSFANPGHCVYAVCNI
jgi:hypothetical protein